ncbi:MAG: hypothetical protein COW93_02350 [Parcubacteria group bacterium CG22_combo_CG10-13_8_21_14_all_41_9]|nr:MAG: hypothetical protein COW93_02350 [Parcubacteria group bacterium CG22_combo_CG10-13_8_21_14_all_41_9]
MYTIYMNNQHIERIFIWIIKACFCLMMFAPLLLCANYFFPAIFPKAIYIRILIEISLAAYIPLAVLSPQFRPKYNLIYASITIFAVIVLFTSIIGENFSYSFWGNYERMDGVFSWMHYWAAIVVASSVIKEKKQWLALLSFSVFAAVLMSLYGFLQRAGIDHFGPWAIYETNLGRITGTIGNPAFLAVYLLFNIVFALLIAIESTIKRWWRFAVCIAIIPVFMAYIMSGVRGAFIGFVAGVIVFFLGNLFWNKNKKIKRFVSQGFFGFVAVLAILYGLIGHNQWVTDNFRRFFNMPFSDSTVQTRLISWRGALIGFKENFLFGVGPQKFDIVFNEHFDPNFYILVGDETWWDRAHNMVLEVATTMGIFGLLSYLGVGLALIYSLYQIGKINSERRVEVLILFAFLIGYFIQNLFVFDTISSYIMLVVLVAYISAQTIEEQAGFYAIKRIFRGILSQFREILPSISPKSWYIAGLAGLVVLVPVSYVGNIKLIAHNKLLLMNLAYANVQPYSKTMNSYKEIFELSNFDNREVGIKISQYMGQRALSGELTLNEVQSGYLFVIDALDQVVEQNPKDVRLLVSYGNTLNVYGEILRQNNQKSSLQILRKAESILREAASLGKARQQVFHSLANTYLIMGDKEKGINTLVQTAKLLPDTPKTYWLLAFAYIQDGQNELGIKAADNALKNNYRFSSEKEAQPVASVLAEIGDYERLLILYEQVAKNINTGTSQAKVAATLAQMGRKEEAIEAARKVVELDPNLKDQVDEFILQVESGEKTDFLGN